MRNTGFRGLALGDQDAVDVSPIQRPGLCNVFGLLGRSYWTALMQSNGTCQPSSCVHMCAAISDSLSVFALHTTLLHTLQYMFRSNAHLCTEVYARAGQVKPLPALAVTMPNAVKSSPRGELGGAKSQVCSSPKDHVSVKCMIRRFCSLNSKGELRGVKRGGTKDST